MEELKQWMEDSAYTVVFTGAGISTDSGIPDFRSPGGLWSRLAPIDFRDFMASDEMRLETWRRKVLLDQEIGKPLPNSAHYAISQLVNIGQVNKIITQNIDNLHQNSGLSEDQVIELHGNGTFAKCLSCEKKYQIDLVKEQFQKDNLVEKLDLVSREEFEVLKKIVQKQNIEIKKLKNKKTKKAK